MTQRVPLEFYLDYEKDWNKEQRRWRLPHALLGKVRKVGLRVDSLQLKSGPDYEHRDGYIYLVNEGVQVGPRSRVLANFQLSWFSGLSGSFQKVLVALIGIIPGVATAAVTYKVSSAKNAEHSNEVANTEKAPAEVLTGEPLASKDYYPIVYNDEGALSIDVDKFRMALQALKDAKASRAAADLIYLGQGNGMGAKLEGEYSTLYAALLKRHSRFLIGEEGSDRKALLESYRRLVDGIGKTFSGTPIEIVLHDTRDPIHSVVSVQNPITGRTVGSPNSNFGIELIKSYARAPAFGPSYVSYPLTLRDGRAVKSTTVPIFDPKFGLIAFVCMNIDLSGFGAEGADLQTSRFLTAFRETSDIEKIREINDHTRRHTE